jgi:uncharacterized protein RhaS with RHS repeats
VVSLEADVFASSTRFDALNRPATLTLPDGSVVRPVYNIANLLERVDVDLQPAGLSIAFVVGVEYDALGQRTQITYGNGVQTTYDYDPTTSLLVRLRSVRTSDNEVLQDFRYVCDPVGNITSLRDEAQQAVFFNNQVVIASVAYRYDALYRLVGAGGREHVGQVSRTEPTWDDAARLRLPHRSDGQAMRRFSELYEYDAVGNLLRLVHEAANGNWTRTYTYNEPSLIEPGRLCNRLTGTAIGSAGPELNLHDAHGNITRMPHLAAMEWNFHDQLQATRRQVMKDASGETTFYIYDAAGQRVRKVTEGTDGSIRAERTYLGSFEGYRERGSGGDVTLERDSLHIADGARRIALVETRTQGEDGTAGQLIRYQMGNHLGSASLDSTTQRKLFPTKNTIPMARRRIRPGVASSKLA